MSSGVLNKPLQTGLKVKVTKNMIADLSADLPLKPKKPVTPWIAFLQDRKSDYANYGQGMKATEMSVILSKEWREMDRSKYEDDYKRKHEEYLRAVQEYEDSLTDEQRDAIKSYKDVVRQVKAKKQIFKSHPPRLPRNAANMFCHHRSKQHDVKEDLQRRKPGAVFKDLFEEYRNLSADEKKRYIDMQEEDKTRFAREFKVWYESIQNNENLTRAARDHAEQMRGKLLALNYI